jgi:DNA modification methylase
MTVPYWSNATTTLWHANALDLPLPDASVDLIVTSPPYFGLRSYQDAGEHYPDQIGSEATPAEFVDALIAATREMVRVLKPSGSIWINLGDKYATAGTRQGHTGAREFLSASKHYGGTVPGIREKSLIGIPWRYALRCIDELGLILRAEVIWEKGNGLPESVRDRVRRSHEQWFHFVLNPRYYSAVDTIREWTTDSDSSRKSSAAKAAGNGWVDSRHPATESSGWTVEPCSLTAPDIGENARLGKLPGSVWLVNTQPLRVPAHLGVDHFAAFPMEFPRRIIRGWSPRDVCAACGEGRRPVAGHTPEWAAFRQRHGMGTYVDHGKDATDGHRDTYRHGLSGAQIAAFGPKHQITGYACACTPYTDHEGDAGPSWQTEGEHRIGPTGKQHVPANYPPRNGPWREYHWDAWTPAPTTPGVVLDPFGGTGTVSLVAEAEGRQSHYVDLSGDYCRLAKWRITDPGERARARQVEKPPVEIEGQDDLLSLLEGGAA